MMIFFFLIAIGLVPPLLSIWISLRAHRRVQDQFELAFENAANQRFQPWLTQDTDSHYVDGLGFVVGDITCQLNARSPYLRCAVKSDRSL
jgi:hypothetical protein